MMNMGHLADTMSLHDYEELLWHWNEAHSTEDAPAAAQPERAKKLIASINSNPALIH